MKKFLSLLILMFALLFAGCDACAGPTAISAFSPWGRENVLEISTYKITATAPEDKDLSTFSLAFYVEGEGEFVQKITQNSAGGVVIENSYTFTGKYYHFDGTNRNLVKPKSGEGDGTFTDSYTSKATVTGLANNNLRSSSSERHVASSTVLTSDKDGKIYSLPAAYDQTIAYESTKATVSVQNNAVPGYAEGETYEIFFTDGKEKSYTKVYEYSDKDLVYDSETILAVMRSYSVNDNIAGKATNPSNFKVISPLDDNSGLKQQNFAVAADKASFDKFSENIYAENESSEITDTREPEDVDYLKLTLTQSGGNSGPGKVYSILKDEKVRYQKNATVAEAIGINRIVKVKDGMNMTYTLTSYLNASAKAPKA